MCITWAATEVGRADWSVICCVCVPQAASELKEQAQRAKDAAATGPSMSINARSDIVEQTSAQQGEWAYARQVEITNGRWAMLGASSQV